MNTKRTEVQSPILIQKPRESLVDFLEIYSERVRKLDFDKEHEFFLDLMRYSNSSETPYPLEHLINQWFDALDKGIIDYSVYAHDDYVAEAWACWIEFSRKYLRLIDRNKHLFEKEINTIIDLGNGIGKTTTALTEIFPNANVYGTNLKVSEQWKMCEALQETYDFELVEETDKIGKVDLIFASEYFEHIETPLNHLQDVIDKNEPEYMVIANSFGTVGTGHFKTYKYFDENDEIELIDWKKISRRFNALMKLNGYVKVKTGFFNATPNVWQKVR